MAVAEVLLLVLIWICGFVFLETTLASCCRFLIVGWLKLVTNWILEYFHQNNGNISGAINIYVLLFLQLVCRHICFLVSKSLIFLPILYRLRALSVEMLDKHFIPFECGIMFEWLLEWFYDRGNGVSPGNLMNKPEQWSGIHKSGWSWGILCCW